MSVIGFHASHEQHSPKDLLLAVQRAEQAGFDAAMSSDHVSPWSERQGHSGFAWSWLGAAMQATNLPMGVVNAPGQRYHPVMIAQAIATLAGLFDGRFWVALGTGEASNEHITGQPWPRKDVRNARLLECVEVIRALLRGDEVSHDGLVTVDRARIWSLPSIQPQLRAAAVSTATAQLAAGWADGLITVAAKHDHLKSMIGAYRDNGGAGRIALQVHVSYAETDDEALAIAHDQWRTNVFGPPLSWDLDSASAFDAAAQFVQPEAMRDTVLVSSDLGQHAAWLAEFAELGFDDIFVHNVGKQQERFIDDFGAFVLPNVRERIGA
jgi:probable non-F420 flavinoid oxidoreductase